jgi:hypothetical protein
VDIDHIA